jgi:nicotinamide-nucleotide adenylyltransferase
VKYRTSPQFKSHFGGLELEGVKVEIMGNLRVHRAGKWSRIRNPSTRKTGIVRLGDASLPVVSLATLELAYLKERLAKEKLHNVRKTVGVYWGRFNPPHKGHIALIERLSKKVDFLIVAVGNAKSKNTKRNPFSGEERVEMMNSYLKERGIKVKDVIAVEDGESWDSSINNLFEKCGEFDVLFTDKRKIARLVRGRVKVAGFKRKGKVSSTQIRNAIARGGEWESLTGDSVAALIKGFDGIARIRRAYGMTVNRL